MRAPVVALACGVLLAVAVPAGALARAQGGDARSRGVASGDPPAPSPPSFLPVGGSRPGLPSVLHCGVVSTRSLRCRTAAGSARGLRYVLYGAWLHHGAADGLIVLVQPSPPVVGAHQSMIAAGRLGAIVCARTTAPARTCRPLNGHSAWAAGELGVYVRKQV